MIGHRLSVIGWKLDEARAALASDESTHALPIRLLETVAPRKKFDADVERFGAHRVLRCRQVNDEIELTIAREQIVD
jgi:hypothetical protein